ncbi:glycosyltransferase family 4 protein [Pedobacter roseus]|uniref:Glycosyltransferase family 4 protein n=1 Tax=Pedobacter roseus TaxID=336820 RepID=A0A7G9QDM7_9SPHI|nr:glycosyltransferase family 4 protein [Pedobacter roseus]QNN41452.1 glycosyltransferase family 4 protein [Pedobacter roseus]
MSTHLKKLKLYIVSNMYPSSEDAYYGVFVKNFCNSIIGSPQIKIVSTSFIRGRGTSFLSKLNRYFKFYTSILFKSLFFNYDIIYVHNVSHSILPLYPVLLKRLFSKIRIIINPHGEDMVITHKIDGILLSLSLPFIRKADQIVVPSLYYGNLIAKLYNLNPKKIFISPSGGIDLSVFKVLETKRFVNVQEKNIGFISRIDPDKGWDVLLNAIAILVAFDEFKSLKATFVGKGTDVDRFLKLVDILKLSDHVEYLGFKSQIQLPEIINKFDVFVFPTKMRESLGLVGLESMACGVPVIASDQGGMSDYVKDGVNGFTFKCGDHLSLSGVLKNFFNLSTEEVLDMKKNALETAEVFSSNNVKNNMIANLISIKNK